MCAHTEPLRNLLRRVAPFRDLRDSIALEVVSEIARAHHGLLASKLAKKASTKHGAIHIDPDIRRIHLGWEQKATPTDEGVRVFSGLWFSSQELHEKLEETGHQGKVSVFVDPDDVTRATVVIPKVKEPITVDLQITAFADMTLPEVLELIEIWRKEDGMLTEVYEDRLASIRRKNFDQMRAIGVERGLSRSYSTREECAKKAAYLFAGVRVIRNTRIDGTTPAGQIMDIAPGTTVFNISGADMLIDGTAEDVGSANPGSSTLDAVHSTGDNPTDKLGHAPGSVGGGPSATHKDRPKKPKPKPVVLGRPDTLRNFE